MSNAKPLRARCRSLADLLHRWLGLTAGLVFIAGGLTGTLLAFYVEIERNWYPHLQPSQSGALPASYEAVFQRLTQLPVDPPGKHWRIEIPPAGGVITSRYDVPGHRVRMVSIDPVTLEVLRDARWRGTFFTFLYDIHMNLLFGPPGKIAMGFLGLGMAVMVVAGIGAWLLPPGRWRTKFTWHARANRAQRDYDLHKLTGGVFSPLLILIAITGAMICLPDLVRPMLGWISPLKPLDVPPNPPAPPGARRLTVDEILRRGEAVIPGSRVVWIHVPMSPGDVYDLRVRQPGAPMTRFPKTHVFLDQYTGAVVRVNNPRTDGLGDWILDWIVPLHDGKAFGPAGRIAVMLAGLTPLVLFFTGFRRWNQKRTGRGRRRNATPASANAGSQ